MKYRGVVTQELVIECGAHNCWECKFREPYKRYCELFKEILRPAITRSREMTWRRCSKCKEIFKE